tara:strand:- start:1675 stop:2658 length:984 start_codon:yes stop_codon:yes gene_type:complete
MLGDKKEDLPVDDHRLLLDLTSRFLKLQESEVKWKKIRFVLIGLFIAGPMVAYLMLANSLFSGGNDEDNVDLSKGYASMVRLEGMITPDTEWNARKVSGQLQKAFEDKDAKGVVILLNSPGGTPVQSGLINERIKLLKKRFNKKAICVGQDMVTSGAYMVASACDEIVVNRSTVIGSIGVIMKSFAYSDIAQKVGIESRVYTAGSLKNRFDPSQPVTDSDREKAKDMLGKLHTQFIDVVLEGRGDRLTADPDVVFSGDFWTGEESIAMGLADGIMDVSEAVEHYYGVESIKDYTTRSPIAQIIQSMRGGATASLDSLFSSKTEFLYQ